MAEKLKDMSKALIALTLIQDPVERAKAAAHLYKQYSQVAKDYAAATADGRDAAAQATAQDPHSGRRPRRRANPSDPQAAGRLRRSGPRRRPRRGPASPGRSSRHAGGGRRRDRDADGPPRAKPRFVADLYMEEIKIFAGRQADVRQRAVQEAKLKKLLDKSGKDGAADEVKDAKKDLTEAAKAVEGPDATAEVQTPSGASGSAPSASILNIKA